MPYVHDSISLLQSTYAGLNQVQGLLIAVIASILMKDWKQLAPMAFASTLVYLVVSLVEPVFHGGAFRLPEDLLTLGFWLGLVAKFLIFMVIIALFFAIKGLFLKTAKA